MVYDMPSGSMLLLTCAGVLFSGGIILGTSTAWNLVRLSFLFWITDLGVEIGATVLFVAGSILCLPVCWVASLVPSYPKSQPLHGTLLVLTCAALLTLSLGLSSMSSLSNVLRNPHALNSSLYKALSKESASTPIRNAFASLQLEMQCCGIQSYADWFEYRQTLPPACCNRLWNSKGEEEEICAKPVFTMGCLGQALTELRYFANTTSMLASVIVVVLALTMVAAAYIVAHGAERAEQRASKLKAAAQAARVWCAARPQSPHSVPPIGSSPLPIVLNPV